MSRNGGHRVAGFMDGFMSGYDFVDRLQRADDEREYRRARDALEDTRWQEVYGLRQRQEERLARQEQDFLTPEQSEALDQARFKDKMAELDSNDGRRSFQDWKMQRERDAAAGIDTRVGKPAPASSRPGRRQEPGQRIQALRGLSPYIRNDRLLERLEGEQGFGLMEGRTATSPDTGERLVYRSGRWE